MKKREVKLQYKHDEKAKKSVAKNKLSESEEESKLND